MRGPGGGWLFVGKDQDFVCDAVCNRKLFRLYYNSKKCSLKSRPPLQSSLTERELKDH